MNNKHAWLKSYPKNLKWDKEYKSEPLSNLIDNAAKEYPDKIAIDFFGKTWSWKEINDLSNKMAKGLQELGVRKNMKVGLCLPNSPYYIIAYYAIVKSGAIIVNYNPLYAERELSNQIEDSETDIIITVDLKVIYKKINKMLSDTRLQKIIICSFTDILPFPKNILFKIFKFREISKAIEDKRHINYNQIINNNGKYEEVLINPKDDIALLQYTGGTTGVPKGAMLTHYNIVTNAKQAYEWCSCAFERGDDTQKIMLGVIPFFHVFAMTVVMNMSVIGGLKILCVPRFDLKDTLKLIDKKKPDFFPAVPAIYSAIVNSPKLENYNLKSLKYCISGGAPLPVELKKNFESKTGCVVVEGYGLTESSPIACVNPLMGDNKAGSIGLPFPATIVEILDKDDKKTVLGCDKEGELCIAGPQVMKGYWNNKEATSDVIINGRLHTGDVARIDKDGYVYIVDRIKDMIITNGYNVYPRNVEEAIYLHPSIEECIVAGIKDKTRGEIVKVWVKLKDNRELSADDLKQFLADKISPMEIPKRFEFRKDPLPKTMIGKLSRKDVLSEENKG